MFEARRVLVLYFYSRFMNQWLKKTWNPRVLYTNLPRGVYNNPYIAHLIQASCLDRLLCPSSALSTYIVHPRPHVIYCHGLHPSFYSRLGRNARTQRPVHADKWQHALSLVMYKRKRAVFDNDTSGFTRRCLPSWWWRTFLKSMRRQVMDDWCWCWQWHSRGKLREVILGYVVCYIGKEYRWRGMNVVGCGQSIKQLAVQRFS